MPSISQSSSSGYRDRPGGAIRTVDIPKSGDIPIVTFGEVMTKMFGTDTMINTVNSAFAPCPTTSLAGLG